MNVETLDTHKIATGDEHPVRADLYRPAGYAVDDPLPHLAVLSHGFKGYRRWGFIPHLALALQSAGIATLSVGFSHNGRDEAGEGGDPGFSSVELFRRNTLRRERTDLETVLEWARSDDLTLQLADNAPIGLWGHSRGGIASILLALEDPDIRALSTWATACHPDTYKDAQKEKWREKGALEFNDVATRTRLGIGVAYLNDIEANADYYDLGVRAGDLTVPHLIIHGESDLAVPVADGQKFYDTEKIRADKKLLRLLTGHTFGYAEGNVSEALTKATEATAKWFVEHLSPQESNKETE
jgi:dienelactone hydrolase